MATGCRRVGSEQNLTNQKAAQDPVHGVSDLTRFVLVKWKRRTTIFLFFFMFY